MRELVDVDFKEAERIRVVLDNLSTHTAAALYAAFHRPRRAACSGGLSSTTRPNTPAGSTWLRSRSACSKANVSIVASKAATASLPRSTHGRPNETKAALEFKLDVLHRQGQTKWRAPIPVPCSKSYNHRAGELVGPRLSARSRRRRSQERIPRTPLLRWPGRRRFHRRSCSNCLPLPAGSGAGSAAATWSNEWTTRSPPSRRFGMNLGISMEDHQYVVQKYRDRGLNIFYREAGEHRCPNWSCSTASRPRPISIET